MITIPPSLVERSETHYVAVARHVSMSQLDEVAAWLTTQGIELIGAPLIRYRVIDMNDLLQVEIGWPLEAPVEAPSQFIVDVLPAGTYGSATYRDVSEGVAGNAALLGWGNDTGVAWDYRAIDEGDVFASRVEFFLTGPEDDSDPTTWLTEVVIKVAEREAT
jgi:hypothetical protein